MLGLWLSPTLSLLSTALNEEVLGLWDSKFTQEPASTSLEKLLNFVLIFSGHAAHSTCGKKESATRILGIGSKCCPLHCPRAMGHLRAGSESTHLFWCLGFLFRQNRILAPAAQGNRCWLDLACVWTAEVAIMAAHPVFAVLLFVNQLVHLGSQLFSLRDWRAKS